MDPFALKNLQEEQRQDGRFQTSLEIPGSARVTEAKQSRRIVSAHARYCRPLGRTVLRHTFGMPAGHRQHSDFATEDDYAPAASIVAVLHWR